ncbi:acyl-CoA dehydratase activase [Chloroflexota bacterium]
MTWFMGIDIGSITSKGVITKDGKPAVCHLLASGNDYRVAAQKLKEELLTRAGLSSEDIAATVVTGCGANSVPFGDQKVADIRCCTRGINSIFPSVRTVIDVQGQSSQVIRFSETGRVIDFVVSERCAAGSGCFLDIIANVLRLDLKDIGSLSLKSKNPVIFTTGCAVFGESEAISRVSEGFSKEDILAGIHEALANKLANLVNNIGLEKDCAICGGGALNIGLIQSVEKKLGIQLLVPPQPHFVTALGAAIMAAESQTQSSTGKTK